MAVQERQIRNYDLHSWTGITLGLFLYVVSFTGCFALFAHEIETWEDPASRLTVAENPVPINDTFMNWIEEKAPGHDITFVRLQYPDIYQPYYRGLLFSRDSEGETHRASARWDTATGALLPERGDGLSTWILDFHRDLMWPDELGGRQIGRFLVGLAGIVLLLSIVTGVVAHTKIVKEFFTLRYMRSVRLKWQDTHKVIGLWGAPFHTMIAITGAFLGVVTLLLPIMAALVFKGDVETATEKMGFAPPEASGIAAPMLSFDAVGLMRHPESGQPPADVRIRLWGDESTLYEVYFKADTELMAQEPLAINGVTGDIVTDSNLFERTFTNRVFAAFSSLHYGNYGGIALKILYLVLGLALSAVIALGLMMWLERRLHGNEGRKSPGFYRALSRLTIGVTLGAPLATIAVFYGNTLVIVPEDARIFATGWVYFAAFVFAIAYAFFRRDDYRATRELFMMTGLLCIALPLVNVAVTGDLFLTDLFAPAHAYAWVDATAVLLGALSIAIGLKLPQKRPGTLPAGKTGTGKHTAVASDTPDAISTPAE